MRNLAAIVWTIKDTVLRTKNSYISWAASILVVFFLDLCFSFCCSLLKSYGYFFECFSVVLKPYGMSHYLRLVWCFSEYLARWCNDLVTLAWGMLVNLLKIIHISYIYVYISVYIEYIKLSIYIYTIYTRTPAHIHML